jgi:hypothetical protein
MTEPRLRLICPQCGLVQFTASLCRRCKRQLPQPTVVTLVHEVDLTFAPTAPVISLDELTRRAVLHALRKSANVAEAAKRLGIGKTTLYGMINRWDLRKCSKTTVRAAHAEASGSLPPEQNYLFVEP